MTTIIVDDFNEAGLLRASGFALEAARLAPESQRVRLHFSDPDGSAQRLVNAHREGKASVCSLDFCEGVTWAKRKIFEVKEEARGGQNKMRDTRRRYVNGSNYPQR